MLYEYRHTDPEIGNRLLCAADLADVLLHHQSFIYKMRSAGFPMPANVATPDEATSWLIEHPHWREGILNKNYTYNNYKL